MQMHVEATSILAMLCASGGGSATIWGTATIDGAGSYSFRIDVTDGGAGGSGDTFGILLSTGYTSGQQPLGGGDIKIAP